MIFLLGYLLLSVLGFQSALAKVCNDYTRHGLDNNWYTRDGEKLPIMVLMPMNESALMSSISQGIEPAVQLAIQHIRESRQYSFSLITKIYDTEVNACVNVYVHIAGVNCGQCVRRAHVEDAIFLGFVQGRAIVTCQMFGGGQTKQVCASEVYTGVVLMSCARASGSCRKCCMFSYIRYLQKTIVLLICMNGSVLILILSAVCGWFIQNDEFCIY